MFAAFLSVNIYAVVESTAGGGYLTTSVVESTVNYRVPTTRNIVTVHNIELNNIF